MILPGGKTKYVELIANEKVGFISYQKETDIKVLIFNQFAFFMKVRRSEYFSRVGSSLKIKTIRRDMRITLMK